MKGSFTDTVFTIIRFCGLLFLFLPLVACDHDKGTKNEADSGPREAIIQPGSSFKISPFTLQSAMDGRIVNSSEYEGKVRLINFFATWCGPCKLEVPSLIKLQKTYGSEGFSVIGLSVDQGGRGMVKEFAQRLAINYPVLMADDNVIYSFGGINGVPISFLVGRDNSLLQRYIGYADPRMLEADIRKAINDKG